MNPHQYTKLKEDHRPMKGGWAPGDYMNTCIYCGDHFVGDKRASSCADCAYAAKPNPPSTTTAESQPRTMTKPTNPTKITPAQKLILLEKPVRRAIEALRELRDEDPFYDEDYCADAHNLALWLEGVLDENSSYMPWCSAFARETLAEAQMKASAEFTKENP